VGCDDIAVRLPLPLLLVIGGEVETTDQVLVSVIMPISVELPDWSIVGEGVDVDADDPGVIREPGEVAKVTMTAVLLLLDVDEDCPHNAPTVPFTFRMSASEQDSATHSKNDSMKEKFPQRHPTFVQLLGAAAVRAQLMPHGGRLASKPEGSSCALACNHNSVYETRTRK